MNRHYKDLKRCKFSYLFVLPFEMTMIITQVMVSSEVAILNGRYTMASLDRMFFCNGANLSYQVHDIQTRVVVGTDLYLYS